MNLYKITCSYDVSATCREHKYIYIVSINEGDASTLARRMMMKIGWLADEFYVAQVELIATTFSDKPSLLVIE